MQFNEFRCRACGLYFSTDLDPEEVQHCPLCAYQRPEAIVVTPAKELCSECAGIGQQPKPAIDAGALEAEWLGELREAFKKE
jgi:hypothetical protein